MSNFAEYLERSNLLIIDGSNLAFRWKHERFKVSDMMESTLMGMLERNEITKEEVYEQVMEHFREEGAYFGQEFADTIESIASSYSAVKTIVTVDSGKSLFRTAIYPEYKQNRAEKAASQSVVQDAVFRAFFTMFSEAIENEVPEVAEVLRFQGVEADDVATFIINNTGAKNIYKHIWMVTSDRDWDLNIGPNVSRFNWMTKNNWSNVAKTGPRPKEIRLDNWYEHYLYTPEQHLFAKCLEGDAGDNVPGVAGIGPVRAKTLMNNYKTLDTLIAALPIKGAAQYIKNLNEFKDTFPISLKLMDLVSYSQEAVGVNADRIKEAVNNV